MLQLHKFLFFFWKVVFIGYVVAYPDTYEVQDADTNMKFNLLDVLKDYTESEKEHRRDSINDPFENWAGPWMPHRPGEPPLPPKILPKTNSMAHQHDDQIPMGVKNNNCDDGKTNLTVDWDYSPTSYTCFGPKTVPNLQLASKSYCETIPKHYVAMHKCMYETIEYEEDIPLYGTHRPIWPIYGEYKYVPKQRWLHNLEHGGIVMLYHPCANSLEVDRLKQLVKSCLRRHIITPYNLLDENRPLALLSWGCRLTMSHVNKEVVTKFIRQHALRAPEHNIYKDGEYDDQLIEKAKVVSDEQDSILCSKLM